MRTSLNNRKVLSEVVSLEAWQQATEHASHLSLHADVVFREGRIGGEDNSKLRFKLRVKRAELILIIPETEPVSVVRSSVSRDTIAVAGTKVATQKKSALSALKAKMGIGTPNGGYPLSGNAGFSVDGSKSLEEVIEHKQAFSAIDVEQSLTQEGHYKWELTTIVGPALSGRPWDCNLHPRLTLIDERKDRSKGIPPVVNIRIRCLREDLIISDIAIKDESKWRKVIKGNGFKNRYIAAEAYIRQMLAREGFDQADISDPFCAIDLAYVSVDQSGL